MTFIEKSTAVGTNSDETPQSHNNIPNSPNDENDSTSSFEPIPRKFPSRTRLLPSRHRDNNNNYDHKPILLIASLLTFLLPSCQAFKYESKHSWSLLAPQTLCASGVPSNDAVLGPCPQTVEEVDDYDAIVMDEHGYVDVTISGVSFTLDDASSGYTRKLSEEDESEGVQDADNDGGIDAETKVNNDGENNAEEESLPPEVAKTKAEIHPQKQKKEKQTLDDFYHLQIYLVSLDAPKNKNDIDKDEQSAYIPYLDFLQDGKGLCCYEYLTQTDQSLDTIERDNILQQCSPMDVRNMVPRTGRNQKLSAPLAITSSKARDATAPDSESIVISARFRPVERGRHMVVVSNCAADIRSGDDTTALTPDAIRPIRAHFRRVQFKFVSKFGELPLSMMGIVPFYGLMLGLYAILGLIWFRRSKGIVGCRRWGTYYKSKDGTLMNACGAKPRRRVIGANDVGTNGIAIAAVTVHAPPLLGLQRAIYSLVLLQLAFTAVAFAYYLHLNVAVVDIDILYGGTMAALASWTPFSAVVALVHFVTFLSCQAVVMLATDGTWLIQSTIRSDTKRALYALGTGWAVFFVSYAFISRKARLAICIVLGGTWVAFLLFNVRRSLRHLRTLMVGASNETVMAAGGALVAKRSMYRKMCAVVAIYPVIFIAGVLWNAEWQQDSWAWVGYVLGDVYVFVILLHASIAWLPRPLAAMEFAKYSPLESKTSSMDDAQYWEEDISDEFDDFGGDELS